MHSFGFIWLLVWGLLFSILSKSRGVLYKSACFINRLPILHGGKDHDLLYGLLIASFIHVSWDIAYSLHKLLSSISVCVSVVFFNSACEVCWDPFSCRNNEQMYTLLMNSAYFLCGFLRFLFWRISCPIKIHYIIQHHKYYCQYKNHHIFCHLFKN